MVRRPGHKPRPNLHESEQLLPDNPEHPFIGTSRFYACVKNVYPAFYGCSFNQFIKYPKNQLAAVVGREHIFLYQFQHYPARHSKIWRLELADEDLFTVAWCYDKSDAKSDSEKISPHKIVCAGETGRIFVIDSQTRNIDNVLYGHGFAINDVRTCPFNSEMLLSASKDYTVRIFHIRNETCLLILAGALCHVDTVLSADWSPDGDHIISCGFDHKVIKWNLKTKKIKDHFTECLKRLKEFGKNNIGRINQYSKYSIAGHAVLDIAGCSLIVTEPVSIIQDIHFEAVDCVRTVQFHNQIYMLSKACGRESSIKLWRHRNENDKPECLEDGEMSTGRVLVSQKPVVDGKTWFGKFEVDPRKRWVVIGGSKGYLHIFDMQKTGQESLEAYLPGTRSFKAHPWTEMIRQVSFSDQGRIMIAVGDEGVICRLDRVPESIKFPVEFDKDGNPKELRHWWKKDKDFRFVYTKK